MILTVSGWRHWTDRHFIVNYLNKYLHLYGAALHFRVADADGVDKFTREWLDFKVRVEGSGLTYCVYHADWTLPGRSGGPIRNGQMLRGERNHLDIHPGILTDELLAFPQPGVKMRSPGSGTAGCIIEAQSLGVGITIPGYRGPGTA